MGYRNTLVEAVQATAMLDMRDARRFAQPIKLAKVYAMDRAAIDSRIRTLIEPFNKKDIVITDATTFAGDLEFDSLTVMDFVAEIEDAFDIIISMNQQAEIENYGQLVTAVGTLAGDDA